MSHISVITKSANGAVHSIVVKTADRLYSVPVSDDSRVWSSWIDDSNATFDDVKNCLDFDLQNELPQFLNTKVLCDIEDKAGFAAAYNTFIMSNSDSFLRIRSDSPNMGNRFISREIALKENITTSAYNRPLNEFEDLSAAANFKALRFKTDTKYAAFKIQLKALRAFFDPDIGPGGGWRCPEGTLNGGQITDRFGRGCGGMTRRLGRLLDSLPLGRRRDVPNQTDLTPQQLQRARRTVQRAGSRDLRRGERYVRRGESRARRQAGRVFDRQQRNNGNLAAGFRRTPEYQRRRSENVAAQVARRRQQRGQQLRRRNIERADRMVAEEISRLEPSARREMTGRVLPPRGGATEQRQRLDQERLNLSRQRLDSMLDGRPAPDTGMRGAQEQADRSSARVQELLTNRPWLGKDDWTPETIEYLSDDDLRELLNNTDIASPYDYQRMTPALRAIEDGKLAFAEAAKLELDQRRDGKQRRDLPEQPDLASMTDNELLGVAESGYLADQFYRRYGTWNSDRNRDTWFRSVAARDLLNQRRSDRRDQVAQLRRESRRQQSEGEGFDADEYRQRLQSMSDRELADEALSSYSRSADQTDQQQLTNEAIDSELASRGLTDWNPNTIDSWVNRNNASAEASAGPQRRRRARVGKPAVEASEETADEDSVDVEDLDIAQIAENFGKELYDRIFSEPDSGYEYLRKYADGMRRMFGAEAQTIDELLNDVFSRLNGGTDAYGGLSSVSGLDNNPEINQVVANWLEEHAKLLAIDFDKEEFLKEFSQTTPYGRYDALLSFEKKLSERLNAGYRLRKNIVPKLFKDGFLQYRLAGNFYEKNPLSDEKRYELLGDIVNKNFRKVVDELAPEETEENKQLFQNMLLLMFNDENIEKFVKPTMQDLRNPEQPTLSVESIGLSDAEESKLNSLVSNSQGRRRSVFGKFLERKHGSTTAKPWLDYRNDFGSHAITPETIKQEVDNLSAGESLSKETEDWLRNVFEVELELESGQTLKSVVTRFGVILEGLEVEGDLVDGQGNVVGRFARVLGSNGSTFDPNNIYNGLLEIRDGSFKNSGFGTVFNQNSWYWLRDAGFANVSLNADLRDGRYVWSKTGFADKNNNIGIWDFVKSQVDEFEANGPQNSFIKTQEQANLAKSLRLQARSVEFDPALGPSHMHAILVLENGSTDQAEIAKIKQNLEDSQTLVNYGVLSLDEFLDSDRLADSDIPSNADPSVTPNQRQRRQRRARVEEPAVEVSQQMADRAQQPNYFERDQRPLSDPVNTDVIEGRSLQQLEDAMRDAEKDFTYGRDPSGSFEAAESFARAYNTIAGEMRQAVRQLQAYENGEIDISEEQANNLESFLIRAKTVFDSALPGFDLVAKSDTSYQMPFGRTVNLGLAHPKFSNDDRLAFIEGRADLIGQLDGIVFDEDVPLGQRMQQVSELFDDIISQTKVNIPDGVTGDGLQDLLRDAARKTFKPGDMKEFFRDNFGVDREVAEDISSALEDLRDVDRRRFSFSETLRDSEGVPQLSDRISMHMNNERDRHIALDFLINSLRQNSANPFNGPLRENLINALRDFQVLGDFEFPEERSLRSSNTWLEKLEDIRSREGQMYFSIAEVFDDVVSNYLEQSDSVDPADRHKFLIDLAEGRHRDAARKVVERLFSSRDGDFQDDLVPAVEANLARVFPRDANNDGLIGLIDEAAARGFIVQDFDPDSAVAQGRQALDRRRNIISKLGKQAEERLNKAVQGAWNKRRSAIGSWMQRRYGRWNATPWKDYQDRFGEHAVTPDNLEDMMDAYLTDSRTRRQIDDWLKNLYEIEYESPDGSVFSSTISMIQASSSENGFVVNGTVDVRLPSGQTFQVADFERVLGANSYGRSAPDTVTNVLLEMNNHDLTNGRVMSSTYMDELRQQGIDPSSVPTSRGSGFATVFNQNAWNWLKDAGFKTISIKAGLEDGPYVWARSGFRPIKRDEVKRLWTVVNQELLKYETGDPKSLIRSDVQAAMLRSLSNTAKNNSFNPRTSPSQMHVIMALEADVDNPAARKKEVREWLLGSDLGLDRAEFDLDDVDLTPSNPGQASTQTANVSSPEPKNATILTRPPAPPRNDLGQVSNNVSDVGDIASPIEIINPAIGNVDEALEFFRQSRSLSSIPNEFWPDVLAANSSSDPNDSNALFYSPSVEQGVGGWVNVYIAKDGEGNLTRDGWAIKNSTGQDEAAGFKVENPNAGYSHSAVFDVVGFNLAATAGLIPYGAGHAGTHLRRIDHSPLGRRGVWERFVNSTILPLHWSVLPDGVSPSDVTAPKNTSFDASVFENAKLKGIPERASLLVHSYVMGVNDRHSGNMASFVDPDGNAYVFPFDYGLLLSDETFEDIQNDQTSNIIEYFFDERVFYADDMLHETSKDFYDNASFAEREELRNRINENFDRMMAGYAAVVSEGFEVFKSRALANFTSTYAKLLEVSPDPGFDAASMEAIERQNIVNRLQQIYSNIEKSVEIREKIRDNLFFLLTKERKQ